MSKSSDVLYAKTKEQAAVLDEKIDRLQGDTEGMLHALGGLMTLLDYIEEQQGELNDEVKQWMTKH